MTDQVVWSSSSADVTIASETVGNVTTGEAVVGATATSGQNVTVSATLSGLEATATLSINSFAYVYSEVNPFGLSLFRVDSESGALTSIGSVSFSPADRPNSGLAVHPTGRFVYATTANPSPGYISLYLVDPMTGALTLSPTTYQAANSPRAMTVDPTGRFLYAANNLGDTVSTLAVDLVNGSLNRLSPGPILNGPPATEEPTSVAVHPSGRYLYTANSLSYDVSFYKVDPETGTLSDKETIPVPGVGRLAGIAIDPSGTYAFIGTSNGQASQAISYRIESDGGLTEIGRNSTGAFVSQVAIDPSGRFAFAVCGSGLLRAYSLQPAALPIASGHEFSGSTVNGIAFDPSGRFAYVSSRNGGAIHAFAFRAQGLTTTYTSYPCVFPVDLVITP